MADQVKVFLSYRRADTQHVAGRVGDRLGEQFELFMDIDTIPPGVDFTDYVRRAVGSCDVLLAFIGDRWVSLTDDQGRRRIDDPTDWVVEEISVALKRGVRVIPVLVENATMPTAAELPESVQALVNRQALPLRHASFSADMTRLVAGIEHAGARRPPSAPATAGPAPVERPTTEHFADRWDSGQQHATTPASLPLRIPNQAPPRRRLIIGIAIIVVAALIGALIAIARPFDRPAASGPTSSAPAPSSAGTPAASGPTFTPVSDVKTLRAHIPPSLSRTCRTLEPTSTILQVGLSAAVQCVPAQGDISGANPAYSFYFAYATPEAAITAYRAYYAPGTLPAGDCASDPAELRYQRDDTSGTLRCYTDGDDFQVFAWTSDNLGIVASAADRSMTYAELSRWWRRAGPV
jgi:hypothetical protein